MSEERRVCFDTDLQIEAYQFVGLMQKFPNHFHEHYVIGFIEKGKRHLSCKNEEYNVQPRDLLLFNPKDNHTCEQIDQETLDYRCLNIQPEVMEKAVEEITGKAILPYFKNCVIPHCELVEQLYEVHQMIMTKQQEFEKEEIFYFLLEQLIKMYGEQNRGSRTDENMIIENVCSYISQHFEEQMTLAQLCKLSGLKKYTLLRSFTTQKGVTPFQYLETVRVNHAKALIEKGMSLSEAALSSGFSDQSHFTRFFKNYIGLTPKQYQNIFKGSENIVR